jgi:hypothetical protein
MNQKEIDMKESTQYTVAEILPSNHTVSAILHYAADNCLAVNQKEYWVNDGEKEKYSCCAVMLAVEQMYRLEMYGVEVPYMEALALYKRIISGLKAMGCPVESSNAFSDEYNKINKENQQTRYAWLKFAAMMAEEQGV